MLGRMFRKRKSATFDGKTFDKERDEERLFTQLEAVYQVMSDGKWRSIYRLQADLLRICGVQGSYASLSARLRDLRKEKFGAHFVDRRHVQDGLYEYRLVPNEQMYLQHEDSYTERFTLEGDQ